MLVTKQNLSGVLARFSKPGVYAVDTETSGLYAYLGHRLFSIILADEAGAVYFNFQDYPGISPDYVLPDPRVLKPVFGNEASYWFAHNAKFDMAMLRMDGMQLAGTVHCTQAIGMVIRNDKFSYSLDNLAAERGYRKDNTVERYIKDNKLWKWVDIPGKKTRKKDKYYFKVPFDIIVPYGIRDAEITRALGLAQLADIDEVAKQSEAPVSIKDIYLNELEVTKALFDMEFEGCQVDHAYIDEALRYENGIAEDSAARFEDLTGREFKDSPKALAEVFTALDIPIQRNEPTAKMVEAARKKGGLAVGNPCFDSDVLENIDNEVARLVLMHRQATKKAGTYYSSFKYFSDGNGVLHCNLKQDGAGTGRMSCAEPNLQNIPARDEDKSNYPVRRAFVPSPEYCLVMIDYQQIEFRLMLEYSEDLPLIEKIKAGHDVHTATAEQAGIARHGAKVLNFLLIYGGGVGKLAQTLGITYDQAYQLKATYFGALPGVKKIMREVPQVAIDRGFIVNWLGRRSHLTDSNFAYKMPNYLIQGGCADIMKVALVRCHKRLRGMLSKVILTVHDELKFKIHKTELAIVPELAEIMKQAYPHKLLPMSVSIEHSWVSWHDAVEGYPIETPAT